MPIHDLGYRGWEGRLTPPAKRWGVMAETGIRLAWQNPWLRRSLIFAWAPALYFSALFFSYEYLVVGEMIPPAATPLIRTLAFLPEGVGDQIVDDPVAARPTVWAMFLVNFLRWPQAILSVLVVGLIAPALIGQDVRSRAFLIYFSRPIKQIEYILGKASVVWVYLFLITTLPALFMYGLAVFLSPSLEVMLNTWHLPLRILVASLTLIIPATMVALAFSSLTTESRYAGFAWFSLWVLGLVAYVALGRVPIDVDWTFVSFFNCLLAVQKWIFGVGPSFSDVLLPLIILVVATVFSFAVLYWRVSAPMRT